MRTKRGPMWPLFAALGAAAVVAAVGRCVDVVEVRGRSMAPSLMPGDRLLVARLPPRPGDVVLAADPRDPGRELIKRVAALRPSGLVLRGDNPAESTDARAFGIVPVTAVRWRVLLRYWPRDRAGVLPPAPSIVEEGGEEACAFPRALIAGE